MALRERSDYSSIRNPAMSAGKDQLFYVVGGV